ncbi:BlaI/MecI/CopY family transcriptional regulator [Enterocloster aldenensis]|uniref:BlaI/MecI/CopY family transcriptional regulator n=1 Tax=Enterocloster aldenensis TaxID=358742 RepID=UPI004024D94A
MEKINLSDGEWKLMNLLWQNPPKTITHLTKELEQTTGWGRNIIITMLKRLEAKGAVRHEEGERAKLFYPCVERDGAVIEETRGFLNRMYQGSLSLMVNAMVNSSALSDEEIEELKAILDKAEEERHG